MNLQTVNPLGRFITCVVTALTSTMLGVSVVNAYEVEVHERITVEALVFSGIDSGRLGFHLGLENTDLQKSRFPSPVNPRVVTNLKEILKKGVVDEDEGKRPINHFYDPANDRPLSASFITGEKSPEWALAGEGEIEDQELGYEQLKDNLYEGLTGDAAGYPAALSRYFYGLGHVIHHIQDMAQPEHARVDPHCKVFVCFLVGEYDPSDYEKLTRGWLDEDKLVFGGYPLSRFSTAEGFWHSEEHTGIADFTNRNFVSPDTSFTGSLEGPVTDPEFSRPSADVFTVESVDVQDLPGFPGGFSGKMEFLRVPLNDGNAGSDDNGHRTLAFSLFSSDLEDKGEDPLYTLNEYVYRSTANQLVPRATSYSAGMLDFALRGRIEMKLPDSGMYSVRDQSELVDADEGFEEIRVHLSNNTPDIRKADGSEIPQDIGAGQVIGIARFRRNDCYEPDLSGEMNPDFELPSGCSLEKWFYSDKSVVVSKEITLESGLSRDGAELTFDFSSNPIPVNARDLVFQVVYRGTLGDEDDAIVVSTLDISEPTFVSFLNMTDLAWIDGEFYTMEEIQSNAELQKRLKLDDDDELNDIRYEEIELSSLNTSVNNHLIASLDSLPSGRFFRLAVLTEAGGSGQSGVTRFAEDDQIVRSVSTFIHGWQVNIKRDPNIYYVTTETRGTYHGNLAIYFREIGDVPATSADIAALESKYDLDVRDPVPLEVQF